MSLTQYLHMIFAYSIPDQLNVWHVLLTRYLHLIFTYRMYYQFSNWNKLLPRYLQTFVSVLVSADVIIKLSKDIYKTRILQKKQKGLLELNWTISKRTREKAYLVFEKYGELLIDSGKTQETTTFIVGLLLLIFGISRVCCTIS